MMSMGYVWPRTHSSGVAREARYEMLCARNLPEGIIPDAQGRGADVCVRAYTNYGVLIPRRLDISS
jgi:hypothetical protein